MQIIEDKLEKNVCIVLCHQIKMSKAGTAGWTGNSVLCYALYLSL